MMPETSPTASATARTFAARLVSTLVLWALMVIGLNFRLDWPLMVIVVTFGLLGTWEYVRLSRDDPGARAYGNLVLFVAVVYWAAASWAGIRSSRMVSHFRPEAIPFWIDLGSLLLIVHGSFLLALRGPLEGEHTLRRILGTLAGFAFTILPGAFFLRLLFFNQAGAHLLLLMIIIVKFGDMGAYLIGSWLGRHKMIPHISPKKTWEGFGGAILGSCVAFAGMMVFDGKLLLPLNWLSGFGFAVLLCLIGVLGDLAESVLKRCHGIKDSGYTLPGIGGILDLTDSMLFAAPVAYYYLRLIS
ncbi:MAG: phosphatidate cytidylyltransferase [Verrucomicrobia bacterium]|nr:phosphatidate cytidylyltransferase [Verrucomicrobiota bacterium]